MAKKSKKAKAEFVDPIKHGVPEDGSEAYTKGFTAADCPFEEGTEEFDTWNEQFDAAADEATEQEVEDAAENGGGIEEEPEDRSVVKSEYRVRYAEAGHPAHCGDELAVLLNNLCLTKKGIDLPRFEHIMEANGVDLSKYNRTSKGWQGRLRMTGRNILARIVYDADGVVKTTVAHKSKDDEGNEIVTAIVPLEGAEAEYRMSGDWMAKRRKALNG